MQNIYDWPTNIHWVNLFQHSKLFIQVKESECECNEPKENAKKGASFSKIRKGEWLVFKLRKYLGGGEEPGNKRGCVTT